MIDANLRRGIENRFEREAAERRGKTPEGYKPLNLNQIITQEGRLFLGVLLVELETLQRQGESGEGSEERKIRIETIKSIISKIESYQNQKNPQQEPQFTTQELQILLGTPDGKEKGIYQKVEEARLEAYRLLSDLPAERLTTQLANVNDNFASFLRGIGVIDQDNKLLVKPEGLRDNFARILANMFIENPNGFNDFREKVKKYNEAAAKIEKLSTQISELVTTRVGEFLKKRLENVPENVRQQFQQNIQTSTLRAIEKAIADGIDLGTPDGIKHVIDNITQSFVTEALKTEELRQGWRETRFKEGKILWGLSVGFTKFEEEMRRIGEKLKEELSKPQNKEGKTPIQTELEEIKTSIEEMKSGLNEISLILHQTFLEHGQEFVSKAILKGTEQAIGEAVTGNIVDNMRETREAIKELGRINSSFTESKRGRQPDRHKMAQGVISRLSRFGQRLLDAFIPPELQHLIQRSK
jgi:hypothetical protein